MIVYFTGTGNSRYCAQALAERLGDGLTDAFSHIRNGAAARLASVRPWVFVAPTYSWRLPRVFSDFILNGSFSGSRDAYFVMSCGSETGNAARFNRALCAEKGLVYRGTLPVVMPENYIALFAAPGAEEARAIADAALPVLDAGAACIRAGGELPAVRVGLVDRLKSGVVNAAFYRFVIRDKAFAVSDACVSCGVCERDCPLRNIELREGRPVWGGRCTHCMACICACPAAAIEYGRKSVGQPRYQCPPYQSGAAREE